jgi:dephospho-CoA kinase
MNNKTIIGLTGGIGSGKSTVAKFFINQGVCVVDADQVARQVVEPGEPALLAIAEHFGDHLLTSEGLLDRAELRKIIFENPDQRSWLESLLHPIIRETIQEQLNQADSKYAILETPLLFETDQHQLVDISLLVDVPEKLQIERTMTRDNNTQQQVQNIMDAQMSREDKQQKADYIINNDRELEVVYKDLSALHQKFLES